MKRAAKSDVEVIEWPDFEIEKFVAQFPLFVDMPGIFLVEARKRVRTASRNLETLSLKIKEHHHRVSSVSIERDTGHPDDPWTELIHGVSAFETLFAKTVKDFAVADVLLVAAAESYINAIAEHVLSTADAAIFDKLSPTGKWLFLPQIMKLKWRPDTSKGNLSNFAAVVARRNKVVHPKQVSVKGIVSVDELVVRLRLDAKLAMRGIKAVEGLISGISMSWRGSFGPDWLKETSAKRHPPCFTLGGPHIGARLGRRRKSRSDGA
jgi:hypothetical protein